MPVRIRAVNRRPDRVNVGNSTAASVAWPMMPAPPYRLCSRRASSSGDSRCEEPLSSATRSATRRSLPSVMSSVDRELALSVPYDERRYETRAPFGATVNARGESSVKRWVRAC